MIGDCQTDIERICLEIRGLKQKMARGELLPAPLAVMVDLNLASTEMLAAASYLQGTTAQSEETVRQRDQAAAARSELAKVQDIATKEKDRAEQLHREREEIKAENERLREQFHDLHARLSTVLREIQPGEVHGSSGSRYRWHH